MAIIKSSTDSQLSGKLGDKVYSSYNGKTYVRSVPTMKKNWRTAAQLMNQQRFKAINTFCKQFKQSLISQIWQDVAVNTTGFRLFLKTNSPAFAKDGSITDPLLLKLSTGDLPLPEGMSAQRTAPDSDTIQVSWQKESHIGGARLNDELMAISYYGQQFSAMTPTGLKRKDLGGIFELAAPTSSAQYLYLFFAAEDRRSFSVSVAFKI